MKPTHLLLFLLLLLVLFSPRAYGQAPTAEPTLVRLQAATFDPLQPANPLIAAGAVDTDTPYYLVQFVGPVESVWAQQITALGGHVLGYIPDNTHIVRLPAGAVGNVRALPDVRWVGPYRPDYKIAPDLALNAAASNHDNSPLELLVVGFADAAPTELADYLRTQGATIAGTARYDWGLLFRVTAPAAALPRLIQHPTISWVERYLEPHLANAEGRKVMGVEGVWQRSGYFGAGQIIAVSDSGLSVQEALSPDFGNRLIRAFAPSEMNLATPQCRAKTTWTDLNGHGTHVAGSVLGNGVRSGSNPANHDYAASHAGAAPEAQLVFMALNTDGSSGIQCIDLNGDFIAKGYQAGARISSNSWGASDRGGYNLIASLVDDYIWRHKDYLVLYAAGNAGPGAQTVGSPGTAKNVLTVGASENNRPAQDDKSDDPNSMASFSSRGPTADGRIKPDVVAPGTWILSVRAAQAPDDSFWGPFNADYAFMGGTSMATPLTAGASALVREWLGKERGVSNPSAALMKAVIMNGATQLPGETTPSNDTGSGRVDLKNTLSAHYAVMDDFVQGLSTGQRVSYTVQIVATTAVGNLIAITAASTDTVQAAAVETLHLTDNTPPAAATTAQADATLFQGEPLPGFATARQQTAIPTAGDATKAALAPLLNPTLPINGRTPVTPGDMSQQRFQPRSADQPGTLSYEQNMIGGGDFEEPGWSAYWNEVWLGSGLPLRTSNPNLVINGFYSMWLGGTESDDALFYPVQFPEQIDNQFPSGITFQASIIDQDLDDNGDPFDQLCVALIDASANFIGPYAPEKPECIGVNGNYTYDLTFSTTNKATLAGQTAYLVVYTYGDAAEPHMSAFVDDIVLIIDFPDVTATAIPSSGPPGSKFLLVGQYNVPYGWVDICLDPCNDDNYIKTAYADARGDIAIFLYTTQSIEPGNYPIQTRNGAGRTANTTITILGDATPTLSVTPGSGPAGSKFQFSGANFLPNDSAIAVTLAGEEFGTVGSNAEGAVAFTLQTTTNTPAGEYEVRLTDSANRSATTTFVVTSVASGDPTLTVTPTSGPPGTTFTFEAANFTASTPANVTLDGKVIGQININAAGGAGLTLETKADVTPGQYTLGIVQGEKQATAQYEVTSGGGNPQTGNGLYVTLVWSDPPAQASAAQTLVNDLDLQVTGPAGTLLGNGGAAPDRRNNVETIRLENPTAGAYVITVQAQRVNGTFGAQPFALIATTKQSFDANTTSVNLGQPTSGARVFLPLVQRQ
jgi:subtilisin family serine protease